MLSVKDFSVNPFACGSPVVICFINKCNIKKIILATVLYAEIVVIERGQLLKEVDFEILLYLKLSSVLLYSDLYISS